MTQHKLKAVTPWFDALVDGTKTFEVRYDDRLYQVGDTLIIEHWSKVKDQDHLGVTPGSLTLQFEVTYVYRGRGAGMVKVDLMPDHVVLGIKRLA